MRKDPYAKERAALRKSQEKPDDFLADVLAMAKGEKGDTPVKGKDYFTKEEKSELIAEITSLIPKPKDADEVDYDLVLAYVADQVEQQVAKEVAKLPKPKDGAPGKDAVVDIPAIVTALLKTMPKMESKEVDYLGVKEYIDKEVAKIKAERPKQINSFTGGGAQAISQLYDVDLSGLTKNANGQYILGVGGGSSLPDQTGNNGKFLTTNGTDPAWAEIPGGGDMLKSVYDPAAGNRQVAFNDQLFSGAYADLTGKPTLGTAAAAATTDFATAAQGTLASTASQPGHTHVIADTTGLQTALDGKAATSHTHTAANITDFSTAVAATAAVTANTAKVTNATHTGDVTGSEALTIANSAVTNAKMANMTTKTYKGRTAGTTGAPEDVPVATLKTDLALVKADVGLGNVDNTTDANKPVSTAQQTALDLKQTISEAYLLTSEASSATPTITGTALRNDYVATALAENATLAAPSGTANASAVLRYRITASGGTRTIGYNAALLAGTITRTTSLAAGSTLTQVYQRVGSTWVCQFESVTT